MTRLNGLLNDSTGQMSRSGQEERECVQSRRLQNRIGNLRSKLPRVDSNHDSAVQSRMSCHWTTGQKSGAMEINRSEELGQIEGWGASARAAPVARSKYCTRSGSTLRDRRSPGRGR